MGVFVSRWVAKEDKLTAGLDRMATRAFLVRFTAKSGDVLFLVVRLRPKKHEVLDAAVRRISVDVMDNFGSRQRTP